LTFDVASRFLLVATSCTASELDQVLDDIDDNDDQLIDEEEFTKVAQRLEEFRNRPRVYVPEPIVPSFLTFETNEWRNPIMDVVVVVNLIMLMHQTNLFVNQNVTAREDPRWERLDLYFFTTLYMAEFVSRVLGGGIEYYFSRGANVVDFTVTVIPAVFTWVLTAYMKANHDFRMYNLVLLARLLRIARLITERPLLEAYFATTRRLGPAISRMGVVMLPLFYGYCALGEQLFGGLLREGNPDLAGTSYADDNLYDMNFNDWGSSMMLLFCLLMINFSFMDAIVATSGSLWSRLYFITFNILGIWVILGVFVAFIIECFIDTVSKLEEERGNKTEEEGDGAAGALEDGKPSEQTKLTAPEAAAGGYGTTTKKTA